MEMEGLIGQSLGNWRLKQLLGEGAFGAVFEAEHTAISGRRGAVKVLKPEMSTQASMKQRFLNEASAASRAEHENIVQIFDGGIAPDGTCYQVMEMLQGTVLTKLIQKEGRVEIGRAINITVQIASALQAAHNLQIVHRDLKPDNVFIIERANNPEFVKVLDFGVAKLRGDPSQPTNDKLTSTGMIIGTAPYMSPEQWQARPDIDGRADIYALGVILFEMLCGRRPYSANNAYEWIMVHMEATLPDPAQFGVNPQFSRVLKRMLARQPELRQQTMREVIQDLRTAARGLRNISAFGGDGTATAALPPSAVSGQQVAPPAYVPAPVSQAAQPTAHVPAAPAYVPPAYVPPPAYVAPAYVPPTGVVAPQPYQQPLPLAPGRPLLRRIGEILIVTLVIVGYLVWNWRDTKLWFHGLIQSFKPNF